jgi:hypothetical protein
VAWNPDHSWTPPSLCSTGIEETLLALGVGAAAAAPEVGTAATFLIPGTATALPAAAGALTAGTAFAPAAAAGGGGLSSALGALSTASTIGGTAAQLAGTQQQSRAAQQEANSQAAALQAKAAADRVQANTEAGYAQRLALNERRKTELVLSRQRSLAAAGGGYATDPSTITAAQDIAGQGEYNALSQLAAGQTREAALNYQSDIDLYQAGRYRQAGALAPRTGLYAGAGTLFSGLGTLTSNLDRQRRYPGYS